MKGDISHQGDVRCLVEDADYIVNFAAETHVDRSIFNPRPFIQSNIVGAYVLLEEARKADVKAFLQVSTDEVYGHARGSKTFQETDPIAPANPYSATKAAAESLTLAYHRTYGMNCLVTRSTNNFGPYQSPEKLIPKAIIRLLKGMKVPLYGGGAQIRSWIYVLDNVDALKTVLFKGKAGEVYNVTSEEELTNRSVVEAILSILGKGEEETESVEDRPGHDFRYSIDSSKIRDELNWKPKHRFTESIKATVDWYVNNRSWWEPKASAEALSATPWRPRWKRQPSS